MITLTLAVLVATGPGATAHAAHGRQVGPDPVAALERMLINGHGIRFFVTGRTVEATGDGQKDERPRRTEYGRVEFRNGGLQASDLTSHTPGNEEDPWPTRWITFTGQHYVKSRDINDDGTWGSYDWTRVKLDYLRPQLEIGYISLLHVPTLRAVLASTRARHTTSAGTVRLDGIITLAALYKADPRMDDDLIDKPTAKERRLKVAWRLWIGKDGLIRRAWASWTHPLESGGTVTQAHNMRITGWGSKVKISPPRSYPGD
ncbi:hypothetical protein DP939_19545 [Spongiactinospora rosea]|uniref:Uncharacterized protein n=2 Tax=Spongiactinospora rosea TaxID=2248750 RepID=A0A366LXI2_9ACTN|nr:hypothetical protein DP939_19545 [Spongiactinospora rosea]